MALTNAEKQQRFREKRDAELQAYRDRVQPFLDALATAAEKGRCPKLTNNLPDEPFEALEELTRRLEERRLVVCRLENR